MNIAIPQPLKLLGRAFSERGVSLYAVGGLVRNTLLGLPLSDWEADGAESGAAFSIGMVVAAALAVAAILVIKIRARSGESVEQKA